MGIQILEIKRWLLQPLTVPEKVHKMHPTRVLLLVILFMPTLLLADPVNMQYIYDPTGQLIKVIDSDGNLVEYVYDETGNRIEIKRSLVSGLTLFHFTPATGPKLITVTIEGQGFSPNVEDNLVQINGVSLPVNSASENTLNVTIPLNASSGPIQVTVSGQTAQSDRDFIVQDVPVITGLDPAVGISDKNSLISLIGVQINGENLNGASFTFEPLFSPPALTILATNMAPDGRSATLDFDIGIDVTGAFTLLATNNIGNSSVFADGGNTFLVLNSANDDDRDALINGLERVNGTDPLNHDSDGDGFNDFDEVNEGSDPLDPKSLPPSVAVVYFTVFNQAAPGYRQGEVISHVYSMNNTALPSTVPGTAMSINYSVENTALPVINEGQAISPLISIENTN